jgi:two-component system, NarL family, response regulator LiaR
MAVRILIVDDSAIFRQGLRTILEEQRDGAVCGVAVDGVEAVQQNRDLRPNLIIMDFSMPRMSGLDAARQILAEFPNVPILMVTLYLTRQLEEDARKVGIRETLSKTALSRLVRTIRQLLEGQSSAANAL